MDQRPPAPRRAGLGDEALDRDLDRLLAETNDQRRRFGQALWFLHRTLLFWGERGRSFGAILRLWAPAGAALFGAMAAALAPLAPHAPDVALRRFAVETLRRLAADLARGDALRTAFLLHLETRFPAMTELMRGEGAATRIFDHELARLLAQGFAAIAASDPTDPAQPGLAVARLAADIERAGERRSA